MCTSTGPFTAPRSRRKSFAVMPHMPIRSYSRICAGPSPELAIRYQPVPSRGCRSRAVLVIDLAPGSFAYRAAICFSASAFVGWQPSTDPSASLIPPHGFPAGHFAVSVTCQGTRAHLSSAGDAQPRSPCPLLAAGTGAAPGTGAPPAGAEGASPPAPGCRGLSLPGSHSCTEIRPLCFSRPQSLFRIAAITDSGTNPSLISAAIVVASCAWMAAESFASSRMNGTRASYQSDAAPCPPPSSGRPRRSRGRSRMGSSDDDAFPHKCTHVPSESRRRAESKFPAFKDKPARPSANAGNFDSARRRLSDGTCVHLWGNAASSLEPILDRPRDRRGRPLEGGGQGAASLWYDARVPFMREDAKDSAAIQAQEAAKIG